MISATRTERVGVEADMECGEKGKGEEMGDARIREDRVAGPSGKMKMRKGKS